jgi:hypothetical protein
MIFELRHRLRMSLVLVFVAFCFAIYGLGAKTIPGPTITLVGDILPQIFIVASIVLALYQYRLLGTAKRLIALSIAGLAFTISALTALFTYASFTHPFARGPLFDWL